MAKKINNKIKLKEEEIKKRLEDSSILESKDVLNNLQTSRNGLSEEIIEDRKEEYGENIIINGEKETFLKRIIEAFINPFTLILLVLAVVSFIIDVALAKPGEKEPITVIVIFAMVLISGLLRFIQESKSSKSAENLSKMVQTSTCVLRDGIKKEIALEEVVVGDIIYISAGDIIPADMRIIEAKDLFLSQSSLTGESIAIEKLSSSAKKTSYTNVFERENLAFMGSTTISGSAVAVVVATGMDTIFGKIAKAVTEKPPKTNFEEGINSVSWVLIRYMLIMVPIVFFIIGLKGVFENMNRWLEAFLFAISIAVGLTPEMLPMIVTSTLAKGAVKMSKKKTIIKDIHCIQSFGAMDVLCTDKTGTLTQDKVVLEEHMDVHGNSNARVLRHAYLNSYFQTGLKNLMDISIIDRTHDLSENEKQLENLAKNYQKVDEIPFDFARRRMSVVVKDAKGKTQIITKGAVEEILSVCSFVEFEGVVTELSDTLKKKVLKTTLKYNDLGYRVIAVAQKTNPPKEGIFSVADECEMVLIGYLAFLDPPKESCKASIKALKDYGVDTKILTGDNDKVTIAVCKKVGINITNILLGEDVDKMSEDELKIAVEKTNVFAKLSPEQKARVVLSLKSNGHVVGFMGDGINDAIALKTADLGISVDTAVDIAKESANAILLEKDLMVLADGIVEGRKVYANMIKYIKLTASSNFGNMFSVLVASAFLPFLPMLPVQLIVLNLVYDVCCTSFPWDNVDKEFIMKPRNWEAKSISKFMLWIGPTSSVFDIVTYVIMFFVICPKYAGGAWNSLTVDKEVFERMFQAGWFIESMWTQTLVIHLIRTSKTPFIKSRASLPVTLITFLGIGAVTALPFTNFGDYFGFVDLPPIYFAYLFAIVFGYVVLVTIVKKLYIKRHKEFL